MENENKGFIVIVIILLIFCVCGVLYSGFKTKSIKQKCIENGGKLVEDRYGGYGGCIYRSDKE